uniref:39S ribosomal protein L52, mitochondrial n=1 Tax=Angiostrongylus cantonensis TaxID=6313 RepID=A0A0K0DG84_ANGCA
MVAFPSVLKLHYLRKISTFNVVGLRYRSTLRGRFQNWKKPVYSAPYVNPLEVGPDFSIVVTSKLQLKHKLDQLRLAKKIVQLLSDVKEMEVLHKNAQRQRLMNEEHMESIRPKSKGMKSIV